MTSTHNIASQTSSKQKIRELQTQFESLQEEIYRLNEIMKTFCLESIHSLLAKKHEEVVRIVKQVHKLVRHDKALRPSHHVQAGEPKSDDDSDESSQHACSQRHKTASEEWGWGDERPFIRRNSDGSR